MSTETEPDPLDQRLQRLIDSNNHDAVADALEAATGATVRRVWTDEYDDATYDLDVELRFDTATDTDTADGGAADD